MSVKITEKDFAAAFRAQVDAEADDLLVRAAAGTSPQHGPAANPEPGRADPAPARARSADEVPRRRSGRLTVVTAPTPGPDGLVGRRRHGRAVALTAAAAVTVVGGVAALLVGPLTDDGPDPGAAPVSVVSIVRDAVPDGPVVVGRLGVLDGCLAISPGTLVAVNPPIWQWDALRGALTWIASSSSEPFRIGDDLRVAGTLVPASQLRADGVELPTSCADFAGDVLLLGSPVPRTDDAPALPRLGTGETSSPQG